MNYDKSMHKSAGGAVQRQRVVGGPALDVSGGDSLVFVVDVSGSMEGPRIASAVAGASVLLPDAIQRGYRVAVVSFAGSARVELGFTNKADDARRALSKLELEWTGTNLHRGIKLAHKLLAVPGGDRCIAIFSDGETNVSKALAAAKAARDAGIRFMVEFGGDASVKLLRGITDTKKSRGESRLRGDHEIRDAIAGMSSGLKAVKRESSPQTVDPVTKTRMRFGKRSNRS